MRSIYTKRPYIEKLTSWRLFKAASMSKRNSRPYFGAAYAYLGYSVAVIRDEAELVTSTDEQLPEESVEVKEITCTESASDQDCYQHSKKPNQIETVVSLQETFQATQPLNLMVRSETAGRRDGILKPHKRVLDIPNALLHCCM